MTAAGALAVCDLAVSVGQGSLRRRLFTGVTFELKAGRCRAWMGPSGVGKTTLLRALVGLHRRDRGAVRVGEALIKAPSAQSAPRMQMLFQDAGASLEPGRTPLVQVMTACKAGLQHSGARVARKVLEARARDALEELGIHGDLATRSGDLLSAGERQRVAWARVLAVQPRFLLLDEPTTGLDPELRRQLAELLRHRIHEQEMGVLVVSHDGDFVRAVAHEIQLVQTGCLGEVTPWPPGTTVLGPELASWLDWPRKPEAREGRESG